MKYKKEIVTLALSFSIVSSGFLPVLAANFADLRQDYWAFVPIQTLADQNIISGYSDSTFRPDNPVTRAEFSTMIVKALNREDTSTGGGADFRDVPSSFWASASIKKAYNLGLIKGFPGNLFKPNAYITRTEVMSILGSASQSEDISLSQAENILNKFYDQDRVPKWAVVPVAKAVQANLVVNYPQPNFLMPEKRATRAEVAAMLLNLRNELGLPQSSTQPDHPWNQQGQQPYNQQNYNQSYNQQTVVDQVSQAASSGATTNVLLRGSIATIQENSVIPTVLEAPLSSEISKIGDAVYVKVSNNITTSQGVMLIPAGSTIKGNIVAVNPAKLAGRNASMNIKFNTLTLPNGQTFPFQASIATETGMLEAGSLKSRAGKVALTTAGGAASGAALGTALGAITGKTGKGAIYGTAIGGGLGIIGGILSEGGAIQVPSGEPLFLKLDYPVSVDINSGQILR